MIVVELFDFQMPAYHLSAPVTEMRATPLLSRTWNLTGSIRTCPYVADCDTWLLSLILLWSSGQMLTTMKTANTFYCIVLYNLDLTCLYTSHVNISCYTQTVRKSDNRMWTLNRLLFDMGLQLTSGCSPALEDSQCYHTWRITPVVSDSTFSWLLMYSFQTYSWSFHVCQSLAIMTIAYE